MSMPRAMPGGGSTATVASEDSAEDSARAARRQREPEEGAVVERLLGSSLRMHARGTGETAVTPTVPMPATAVSSRSLLAGKYVALYFSSLGCPACEAFTPLLASAYSRVMATGHSLSPLQVVLVSAETSKAQFKSHVAGACKSKQCFFVSVYISSLKYGALSTKLIWKFTVLISLVWHVASYVAYFNEHTSCTNFVKFVSFFSR